MKGRSLFAVILAVLACLFLASISAGAAGDPNAGTIKVKSHGDSLFPPDNDPHISGCPASFDVFAYNFSSQHVSWTISQQPPTGTNEVAHGSATLVPIAPTPPQGMRFQGYLVNGMTLPDGHYKIVAHEDGTNAEGKQKVFWVESNCPSPSPGGGTGGAGGAGAGGAGQGAVLGASATLGAGATGAVLASTGLPIAGGLLGGLLILISAGLNALRRRI